MDSSGIDHGLGHPTVLCHSRQAGCCLLGKDVSVGWADCEELDVEHGLVSCHVSYVWRVAVTMSPVLVNADCIWTAAPLPLTKKTAYM